jgi:hypothetical protein
MAFVRDEECNHEFERELDEVARIIKYLDPKRILHGCCRTTRILGGQMYPNYQGMAVMEKKIAKDEYEKKRKAFTDQQRAKRLKEAAPNTEKVESFTGCFHPTLRTISEVEKSRLKVGHTFPSKEILKLRVAKEANNRSVHFYVPHSEVRQYKVYRKMFADKANKMKQRMGIM